MLLIAMNIVLADAITGVGFPAIEVAEEAVKGGLATFTGALRPSLEPRNAD